MANPREVFMQMLAKKKAAGKGASVTPVNNNNTGIPAPAPKGAPMPTKRGGK